MLGFQTISAQKLADTSESAKMTLGSLAMNDFGDVFRYVKANEALTKGDALVAVAKTAWETGGIAVNGIHAAGVKVIAVDGNTNAVAKDTYAGYWISQATATGLGKAYQIASHDALVASSGGNITLVDATEEAFADDAALLIFHPFLMEKVDATTEDVVAIAQVDIAAGSYGWVQVAGHVKALKVGHSTSTAIVVGEPLSPVGSSNAGAMMGVDMSTVNEATVLTAVHANLFALQAVAANTTGFIEATLRRTF